MNKQAKLFLGLIIVGVVILIGYHLTRPREEVRPPLMMEEGFYQLGDIVVDTLRGEIQFRAQVQKREGWVRFLVYLSSYRWLKGEAAITSPACLTDLQKAIALLDWQLWDQLWHRQITGQEIEVSLKWQGGKADANELIQLPYHLGIGDLIFLGSPLFDPLFLARCDQTIVCVALKQRYQCPLFFLQESVKEKFTRACGDAGYHLNPERLPPPGTRVTVIIRVPDLQGGR